MDWPILSGLLEEPTMFPIWVYFTVALAISLIALGIAQLAPGFGMVFVALTATLWTTYSVSRQRRFNKL